MKKLILMALALIPSYAPLFAQENNASTNTPEDNRYESLAEDLLHLKKKNDKCNIFFNVSYSFTADRKADQGWTSHFADKEFRFEITGNLTDRLFYRFRQRLNRSSDASQEDNFAKATDYMMIGYHFNKKVSAEAGKMCLLLGGFEIDENPIFIYEPSDMLNNLVGFMSGTAVNYSPIPTQTLSFQVCNAYNDRLQDEYGTHAQVTGRSIDNITPLTASRNPLICIINWDGMFFRGKLETKWSWNIRTQARHKYERMFVLGQKLKLPKFEWYLDWMNSSSGLDLLKVASSDLSNELTAAHPEAGENLYFSDVHYNSFITKASWKFSPRWHLVAKGTYETSSVSHIQQFRNYRKSLGYVGSLEYYPVRQQDLRLFLAFIGHHHAFSKKCGLKGQNTSRVEIGFMYRLKAF